MKEIPIEVKKTAVESVAENAIIYSAVSAGMCALTGGGSVAASAIIGGAAGGFCGAVKHDLGIRK